MSPRRLVLVFGITLGDYLLWNWSLNANRDVLALVSGLTLPPLALTCLWLLALSGARLIARSTGSSHVQATSTIVDPGDRPPAKPAAADASSSSSPSSASASGKIAA